MKSGCLNNFTCSVKTDNAGTSTSTQFTFPTVSNGTYNCIVSWGDGSSSAITTYNDAAWTHTYSIAGTYTIIVSGIFVGLSFNNGGDKAKILTISRWGQFRLGNNTAVFTGCSNLKVTARDILDLTGTTSLSGLFQLCSSLESVPSINQWDTRNITNMVSMFRNCTLFNQPLSFNTASVTTFSAFLRDASSFNSTVTFTTTSAIIMANMFQGCTSFNQTFTFSNTSLVTDFSSFLNSCTVFNQSVSTLNTSSATAMGSMFQSCPAFNQSLATFNTSNVTNMGLMLALCNVFNQPLSTFNTSKVTNMTSMLSGSLAFNQDISMFDIRALTVATAMLQSSSFNITNYDKLLDPTTGWPSQATIQSSVVFSAGSAHYSAGAPTTGRAYLTGTKGWTITDGGTP